MSPDIETLAPDAEADITPPVEVPLSYPRVVFIILSMKLLDRIAFFGFRSILVVYLTQHLLYSPKEARILFHSMNALVFLCGIFGAIISDCWLRKFWTVILFAWIYVTGMTMIVVGTLPGLEATRNALTLSAMFLIAIGTGSMKPVLISLGGDQFRLPQQTTQLSRYYAFAFMTVKLSHLIGSALTPSLRHDVFCFGERSCYFAAFGLPAVLVILSFGIFIGGRRLYIIKPLVGNMIVRIGTIVGDAVRAKWQRDPQQPPRRHWLDYATPAHGAQMVSDIRLVLRMLTLFMPIIVYYALTEQVGSSWTLQAARMSGDLGGWYTLKPDQLALVVQLLIIVYVWVNDLCLNDVFAALGLRTELQRIAVGCAITASAFLLTAGLEMRLDWAAGTGGGQVHMVWALPQCMVLAFGEAMVGVNGWRFSYMMAPESMRTVMPAVWLLMLGGGNALNVLIISLGLVREQSMEFLLFSGICFANVLVFLWLMRGFYEEQAAVKARPTVAEMQGSAEEMQALK